MWIAPFDSVVISLKLLLSYLAVEFYVTQPVCCGRCGSVRVLHCTVLVVCLLRVWLGVPIGDILN